MKTFKLLFCFTTLFFLFCFPQTNYAVPVEWLGGVGNWMDPTKWDTGTVPTNADEVTIDSGTARIWAGQMAEAENLIVLGGGVLKVFGGGTLTISNCVEKDGIHNQGRVYIWGNLYVSDIVNTTIFAYHGIHNEDYFFVGVNGVLDITNVDHGYGIYNSATGYYMNRGTITMVNLPLTNIYNKDRFRNTGTILLSSVNTSGIINKDNFINYGAGLIDITEGTIGIYNTVSPAIFKNYGEIRIEDALYGIQNKSQFTNFPIGEAITTDCGFGFKNFAGANFTNKGSFRTFDCTTGMTNAAHFDNQGTVGLYEPMLHGIENEPSSTFENSNQIVMYGSTYALRNRGDFTNTADGLIFCYAKIYNVLSSTITNDGFWVSDYDGTHYTDFTSSFVNNTVIEDLQNSFSSSNYTNLQVMIQRIAGPMQNGVIFTDPIEVVSTSNISINDWKDNFYGATNIVGTYDATLNEFLPNTFAVGQSEIFINIDIIASGQNRHSKLMMDNPVIAIKRHDRGNIHTLSRSRNETPADISVYPNPSTGSIYLKSNRFENTMTEIQIYNLEGQKIMDFTRKNESEEINFDMPDSACDGLYLIQTLQNGELINSERISLIRG